MVDYEKLHAVLNEQERQFNERVKVARQNYHGITRALDLGRPEFTVVVHSYWTKEGEQDVTLTKVAPLEDVLAEADMQFSKTNGRIDDQRRHAAFLSYRDMQLSLPEDLYADAVSDLAEKRKQLNPADFPMPASKAGKYC